MKSLLTSLAIAAAGAVLLVIFKMILSGTNSSLVGDVTADNVDASDPGQAVSALVVSENPTEATSPRMVDPVAQQALEQAMRDVEEAEANYARIERELETLEAEMDMLDPDVEDFVIESFLVQAEPLLDQIIAAEEAVQLAKDAERAARDAVEG